MTGLPDTLDGVIRLGVREALFDARSIVPAKVETWNPAEQTVDAKPLIKRVRTIDGERLVDDYPVITRVPVSFVRWGGFVIRCPVQAGDIVTLVVSDREMERWLAGDGSSPIEPRGQRIHSLNDAIAMPGVSPWASPIPDLADGALVIGREDGAGELRILPDGSIELGSAEAQKRGVARLNDSTRSNAQLDPAFWQWVTAADVMLRALGGLTVPLLAPVAALGATFISTAGPLPAEQVGEISSASDESSTG